MSKHEQNDILNELRRPAKPCPFYLLPKTTKNPLKCRPVSNHHDAMSAPLSRWIHQVSEAWSVTVRNKLRDLHVPIYALQDTIELVGYIADVNETLSKMYRAEEPTFLTHDHKSLYTHVTMQELTEGLGYLHSTLGTQCPIELPYLLDALGIVYRSNIIQPEHWDCDPAPIYIQHNGLAMGTPCAPSICNLALLGFEVRTYLTRHSLGRPLPLLVARYIDDTALVALKKTSLEIAEVARSHTYKKHHTVTIDNTPGPTQILDLKVRIHSEQVHGSDQKKYQILHSTHTKPFDDSPLPHYTSALPRTTFVGVVKSQVIRYLRNSSTKEDFHRELMRLRTHLHRQGYPRGVVLNGESGVQWESRKSYMRRSPKPAAGTHLELPSQTPTRLANQLRHLLKTVWAEHSPPGTAPLRVTQKPSRNLGRQLTAHT